MHDTNPAYHYTWRQILLSLFILLACCIVGYWPVSAGIFSLKNDATLYFLPVRFQISEMIQHGHFPFWTPYVNLGHPLYTDMQSGVWNPFVWLISLFGTYTMRSLQIELLIYVYISGVSMFYLLKYFKLHPVICLSLAVCYMLCGFNSDSAQFPYWIGGTAFLPFIFLFFIRTLNEISWRPSVLLSLSVYLLFAVGYPAEFIIIFYFLLAYFIVHLIRHKKDLLKLLAITGLSFVVFILLSLPSILAYQSGLSYITRGGGISLDLAMTNSTHPTALSSWLFPLATWKIPTPGTDLLGKNSFIGLLPFILLLTSFFIRQKNNVLVFLKWAFILSLLLSLGKTGLLRTATYYALPFMDTFRHPSLFRFISIFCGCILAAHVLQYMLRKHVVVFRKIFFSVAAIILLLPVIYLMLNNSSNSSFFPDQFNIASVKRWMEQSTALQWFCIELFIQLPFLFLIYKYLIKKINLKAAGLICIANILIHAMLMQTITVVRTETVKSFQAIIDNYTQPGFPFPDLKSSVNENSFTDYEHANNYGPVEMFSKKTGYQHIYVTPGPLRSIDQLTRNSKLTDKLFNFPLLYKADTALFIKDSSAILQNGRKFILTNDTSVISYINSEKSDSSFSTRMLNYSPTELDFEIESSKPGFYCLVQNYYPQWEVLINNKKTTLYPCNISLVGLKIPEGKSSVKISFRHDVIITAIYIQIAVLLILLFLLIAYPARKKMIK